MLLKATINSVKMFFVLFVSFGRPYHYRRMYNFLYTHMIQDYGKPHKLLSYQDHTIKYAYIQLSWRFA